MHAAVAEACGLIAANAQIYAEGFFNAGFGLRAGDAKGLPGAALIRQFRL